MKKTVLILTILCLAVALFAAGCTPATPEASEAPEETKAADTSWDDIKEKGYFVLGLDDAFPPMGYRDEETNEIVGFDIDLAKEAAKRMGVEVKLQPVVWETVTQELNKGTIDVIWNGCTITEERLEVIDFTKPYMNNKQIVAVLKDSPYQTFEDLAGKKMAIQEGSSAQKALDANKEFKDSLTEVVPFGDNTKAFLDLDSKRVDCVAVDIVVFNYYIAKGTDKYRMLDTALGDEQYGIGIRKDDDAFQAELQKALDEIYADGTAAEISEEWFGSDIVSDVNE
ncbi:MAG: amino acid ABC transporter substrate-binding protein [Christensenellales bacterium]|jgi:polar amino acid transport system substrate-binding protein